MTENNAKEKDLEDGAPKEEELAAVYHIEPTDVMTGDRDYRRYLYYQLKMSISYAEEIDIIVSFLMESGVRMLLEDLKQALDRGVRVRLLTGNYLGITQPAALYLIKKELGGRVDLRFYQEKNRSFHAKAYIFHGKRKSEIYIGSSNLSKSALTSGIEWNYRFGSDTDKTNFELFYQTFEELFYHHSIPIDDEELRRYSLEWKKPAVQRDLDRYEETLEETGAKALYQPRGAQIEALYALRATREEGAAKALLYAATGVGKTLLAAFDSAAYRHVLFVAHREEILYQAARSFRNVRQSDDYGFFNGKEKSTNKSVIFASVFSLGREAYLQEAYFPADYFDYIVIDEFHHAVNASYKRIMEYFKPKFLLGLTATPDRLDGRSIYELCDYNVPFQISLKDAINKGLLVPFRYYGIYDETVDYTGLRLVRGSYIERELNQKLLVQARYDLIYKHYKKYPSRRALGFCCSRRHAEAMAREFCKRGIPAAAVYSAAEGGFSEERSAAISRLKKGEIRVIFSVDMFNEGVDICSVDLVMFLRPTESPAVFLQQLGRGLRKDRDKKYLTVLDFIGNYEKAGNAPFLLSGQPYSSEKAARGNQQDFELPDDCMADFDIRLIDLFQVMAKKKAKRKDRIREEYFRVKEYLDGKIPGRVDLFTLMEDEVYRLCINHASDNPFRNYLEFLHALGEFGPGEEALYSGIGREFLHMLETTGMTKSYKMPVLSAFYNEGDIKMGITEEDIYRSYKKFYGAGTRDKDLLRDKSSGGFRSWSKERYVSEAKKNPVRFLKKSGNGFFVEKEGYVLALCDPLREVIHLEAFGRHFKDIIDYRTMDYYRSRYEKEE